MIRVRHWFLAALAAAAFAAPRAEGGVAATNRWVRRPGAPALASEPGNWSLGHPPTREETALFSYSNCQNAVWDDAAPHEIGGLVLESGYIAVLTIETSPSGSFKTLSVAGDISIMGGAVTHPQCATEASWHLSIEAGGNIEIGPEAVVSASGKGFAPGAGLAPGLRLGWGASHGGQGAPRALDGEGPPAQCPGAFSRPRFPGSGGSVAPGADPRIGHGGGVVLLHAGGSLKVFGKIRADGDSRDEGGALWGGAAGGSVVLEAAGELLLDRKCTVSADGGDAFHERGGGGGGGRIALLCRAKKCDFTSFAEWRPWDRIRIHAFGGVGDTRERENRNADSHVRAAAGTIYIEWSGYGEKAGFATLAVYDRHRSGVSATRLPGDGPDADPGDKFRDGSVALLDSAYVTLSMPLEARRLGFGDSFRGVLDLNGNALSVSEIWNKDPHNAFDETGTYRSNETPALDFVSFENGGSVRIVPYFGPI